MFVDGVREECGESNCLSLTTDVGAEGVKVDLEGVSRLGGRWTTLDEIMAGFDGGGTAGFDGGGTAGIVHDLMTHFFFEGPLHGLMTHFFFKGPLDRSP